MAKFQRYPRRRKKYAQDYAKTMSSKALCRNEIKEFIERGVLNNEDGKLYGIYSRLLNCWHDICGSLLFRHLRPVKLNRNSLIIEASSGIFLEQARFLESQLIEKIEKTLPGLKLNSLEFYVGAFHSLPEKRKAHSKWLNEYKNQPQQTKSRELQLAPEREKQKRSSLKQAILHFSALAELDSSSEEE
jgi:hypothetical protein